MWRIQSQLLKAQQIAIIRHFSVKEGWETKSGRSAKRGLQRLCTGHGVDVPEGRVCVG